MAIIRWWPFPTKGSPTDKSSRGFLLWKQEHLVSALRLSPTRVRRHLPYEHAVHVAFLQTPCEASRSEYIHQVTSYGREAMDCAQSSLHQRIACGASVMLKLYPNWCAQKEYIVNIHSWLAKPIPLDHIPSTRVLMRMVCH